MAQQPCHDGQVRDFILSLNAGSSSVKFGLFAHDTSEEPPTRVALGTVRRASTDTYRARIAGRAGTPFLDEEWQAATFEDLVQHLLHWSEAQTAPGKISAVGHRIVHGGTEFAHPVIVNDQVLERLEALSPLAPLHQPNCLIPVRLIRELRPELVQVACFDTAFHKSIRHPAGRYALPREYEEQGIRHFGFHGLSFESVATQILREEGPAASNSRMIVAHLGNGASLCALRDFRSVDTTMGFSTLDGLVMGTRAGSLDPGILLFLLKECAMPFEQLERLLYHESGLLGVSGITSDVEVLLSSDAPSAKEALELFAFQVARQTAALAATLGGLDRFVFTGGIGEYAAPVRSMIADRLALFGAMLDEEANTSGETRISSADSAILVERRPTQEEQVIAAHTLGLIAGLVPNFGRLR